MNIKDKFYGKGIILICTMVVIMLVVSGCGGINTGKSSIKKYYQGYDSLDLQFLTNSPPTTFIYDPESTDNSIPVVVEVRNKGAADTYGVLFIHGYDPHIMQVAGGSVPSLGNIVTGGTGSSWYLNFQNIYIGLPGGGSNVNFGFTSPNGNVYGLNAFTQDGTLKGMSIRMNPGRIGYSLGEKVFGMFTSNNGWGWNAPIAMQGDTPESPNGDIEAYEFPTNIYYLPASLDQFRQPLMVTACYDYATRATIMMCIDPRPNSATRKPCTPITGTPSSAGQGAPVAITSVEQQSSTKKTVFTIHIHHNKKNTLDELWDLNSLWKCNPEAATLAKPTDKDIVYIGYVDLSGHPIECASNGRIRLDTAGNGQISCTAVFDETTQTAYEAPLEIELWYGYSKSIYKYVTIKRV